MGPNYLPSLRREKHGGTADVEEGEDADDGGLSDGSAEASVPPFPHEEVTVGPSSAHNPSRDGTLVPFSATKATIAALHSSPQSHRGSDASLVDSPFDGASAVAARAAFSCDYKLNLKLGNELLMKVSATHLLDKTVSAERDGSEPSESDGDQSVSGITSVSKRSKVTAGRIKPPKKS